ncbi:MAG: ribonuclease III [Ruminococcaceae bacterium]|nr:ribonuclease III [Oscillospiraceae bacterium]
MKHEEKHILPLPIDLLEQRIGYSFKNKDLITLALQHSSYANELKLKGEKQSCNERLEFFGDSVLSLIVSEYLYSRYVSNQEGDLTKIRAAVVCERALAKYALAIGLGDFLRLGHGEDMNHGRERASITSDAFEAVLAAMYIDSGSLETVRDFLLPYVQKEIEEIRSSSSFVDYKTALQQIVQQVEGELLEYVLIGEHGPDHCKVFDIEARLNSNVIGRGSARSKREAEQLAAKEALILFGEKDHS